MRGKASTNSYLIPKYGITPAYAGKRGMTVSVTAGWGDHPRLCGEKLSDFSIIAKVLGSPPPMRGKAS